MYNEGQNIFTYRNSFKYNIKIDLMVIMVNHIKAYILRLANLHILPSTVATAKQTKSRTRVKPLCNYCHFDIPYTCQRNHREIDYEKDPPRYAIQFPGLKYCPPTSRATIASNASTNKQCT